MTHKYVGVKLVTAFEQKKDGKDGYGIIYRDGYTSWCPKEEFERANMQLDESNFPNKSILAISRKNVDQFVKDVEVTTMGDKTTIVKATLVNGFIIVESSSCVDSENYNEDIGRDICMERIKNKLWEFLGFMLQTSIGGMK